MARGTLTKTVAPGGYAATGTAVTMTAAVVADKEQFVSTGKELVIAYNTNAGSTARTVTIDSAPDPYGRSGPITAHSIAAGAIAMFGPFPVDGWRNSEGYVTLEASHAEVKFGVITLP